MASRAGAGVSLPSGYLGPPALCSACAQGLALTHVLERNLKPEAGLRPEAAKLVTLVTDGKSQDDARTAGQALKSLGVHVFAVGKQFRLPSGVLTAGWVPWPLRLSPAVRT